jgi:hypothetical protein
MGCSVMFVLFNLCLLSGFGESTMTILFMCYSVFSSGSESFCTEDCDHLFMDLCIVYLL